jgi:hypothetical protein
MAEQLGDFRIWRNRKDRPARKDIANGAAMKNVIFPGDVEAKDGSQNAYYWYYEKGGIAYEGEYDDLRDEGYDYVTTDKFNVNRFRVEGNKVYWKGHVLLYIPAEKVLEREAEQDAIERMMQERETSVAAEAEAMGAGVYRKRPGGKIEDVVKPRK